MEKPPSKRRKLQFCPHCERRVSKSTWYRHYSMYYNQVTATWEKISATNFSFSDESDQDFTPVSALMDSSVSLSDLEMVNF